MLKTCSRCGIVPEDHVCPYRMKYKYNGNTKADTFRRTRTWTNKSIEIRKRDKYLCQVCLLNKYNTITKYSIENNSVHHINSINDDYDRRLDNSNLITLCPYHHKMADDGLIPKEELLDIVKSIPPL